MYSPALGLHSTPVHPPSKPACGIIDSHHCTSDHYPISITLQAPCPPAYPPPHPGHTLFRRLTHDEQQKFCEQITPLEKWADDIDQTQVSDQQLCEFMDVIAEQVSIIFHGSTKLQRPHTATGMEKDFTRALHNLPQDTRRRREALHRLQQFHEKWKKRMDKKEKKKLHYSLVRGCKIKKAVEQALNPRIHTPIHLWDPSLDPPRLVTDPSDVGRVFSECFENLGGGPAIQVNDEILTSFPQNVPKCAPDTNRRMLELSAMQWLRELTLSAEPSKATGEDKINYYVVFLLPHPLQTLVLKSKHLILTSGPPDSRSKARVCMLYKRGDPRVASNSRPICLIQTLVKLAASWQCKLLTAEAPTHHLLHLCQHGGLRQH